MKKLILALSLLILPTAIAKYQVPSDAVIKVFDNKGNQIGEMSRKEYKVVKLEDANAPKKSVTKSEHKSNSLIVHLGGGTTGVGVSHNGSSHVVEEEKGPVAGATYCLNLDKTVGLCASAFSNSTFLGGVKFDF